MPLQSSGWLVYVVGGKGDGDISNHLLNKKVQNFRDYFNVACTAYSTKDTHAHRARREKKDGGLNVLY